jgi:hypothetical protein
LSNLLGQQTRSEKSERISLSKDELAQLCLPQLREAYEFQQLSEADRSISFYPTPRWSSSSDIKIKQRNTKMKTFMAWRLAEALSEPLKRPVASKKTRKPLSPTKSKEDASSPLKTKPERLLWRKLFSIQQPQTGLMITTIKTSMMFMRSLFVRLIVSLKEAAESKWGGVKIQSQSKEDGWKAKTTKPAS